MSAPASIEIIITEVHLPMDLESGTAENAATAQLANGRCLARTAGTPSAVLAQSSRPKD